MGYFIHQTYGRLRIRLVALKGNRDLCHRLNRELKHLDGVSRVHASQLTGSVTVHYEPDQVHSHEIMAVFRKLQLMGNLIAFPRSQAIPRHLPAEQSGGTGVIASDVVTAASTVLFKHILEASIQKTGQILLRKLFS